MDAVVLFVMLLVLVATLYASARISIYMTKRSICKVVSIFRANDAVDPPRARPLEEMGLSDRPKFFNFGLRDYKPYAIHALVKAQIIQATFEGRYYLSEREEKELEQRTGLTCDVQGVPRNTPGSGNSKVKAR
ncbi:MAG: hypothetical protein HYX87_09030 [Chloroflexi bacterium]|nr:hypothetical protein [Chloroflexota bacterium]